MILSVAKALNIYNKVIFLLLVVFSLNISILNAQIDDSPIIDNYENYTEAPRENIFVHLNKTTFIKGEMIGFTAYVFDKSSKQLSFSTTNLYCTITDSNNKVIRSGLFMVKKGVTSNVFETDSIFTSGEYTFNAYTNWIRNFKEKNYFSQKIRIIDTEIEKQEKILENETISLDIQALPEGGHLLENIPNTIGIIVKDQFGKGIPSIEGNIVDESNLTVCNFTLDELGIGRATFTPISNKKYSISFSYGYKSYISPIEKAKRNGIALSLKEINNKIIISISTNTNTLQSIIDENYILSLHNGAEIEAWEFNFNKGSETLNKAFNKENLYPGVNIFTIFNSDNSPLLERLYFNNTPIKYTKSIVSNSFKAKDSIEISLKIPNLKREQFSNISISLLPSDTKTYNPSDNILSSTYLKPYLKGNVENIRYYFTDINNKKLYELDNLMITQGWSSYNWGQIFSSSPETAYSFEQGISYRASRNNKNKTQYLIQPLRNSKSVLFNLNEGDSYFQGTSLFPVKKDKLNITEINPENGKTKKPSLYFTFKPNTIPLFNNNLDNSKELSNKKATLTDVSIDDVNLNETQKLDEVKLSVKIERTRYESLKKLTRGTIDLFDDTKRNAYTDFATYIASKGFIVNENLTRPAVNGERLPLLTIYNARKNRLTGSLDSPLIFLNDMPLNDLSVLYGFKMDIVDYIEIDKSGSSLGMRGAFGVIKIYTDPTVTLKSEDFRDIQVVDFPLKYDSEKAFYVPKYKYYNTNFFNQYGTIGWFPNLVPNANGEFNLKIYDTNSKIINLYIEGITNDNMFISEIKKITVN